MTNVSVDPEQPQTVVDGWEATGYSKEGFSTYSCESSTPTEWFPIRGAAGLESTYVHRVEQIMEFGVRKSDGTFKILGSIRFDPATKTKYLEGISASGTADPETVYNKAGAMASHVRFLPYNGGDVSITVGIRHRQQ